MSEMHELADDQLAHILLASANPYNMVQEATPGWSADVHQHLMSRKLAAARELLLRQFGIEAIQRTMIGTPEVMKEYLTSHLVPLPYEAFVCIFLDSKNRILLSKEMFRGTLTQTSVYPREIVREALGCNAAAVLLAHNHPSGIAEPSHADRHLTNTAQQALQLVDVKIMDHMIVAQGQFFSFAEKGLV
jgi:DNA repair protein RadC